MLQFFIGIDGGGTKTNVLIQNAQGEFLAQARSGPANIRMSHKQAWQSIIDGTQAALAKIGVSLKDTDTKFHLGLGLAGTEEPEARAAFLSVEHPFETLCLHSDAYTACLGVHNLQDGAIIIAGTGVVGFQIYQDQSYQVGGWGFPHGDHGGGAWLGMEVLRLALQCLDARISSTPLLNEIIDSFDGDPRAIVTWATQAGPAEFGSLAPYVIKHLEQGDQDAVGLLRQAAREVEALVLSMDRQLPQHAKVLSLGLLGGIAPYIKPFLPNALQSRLVERQFDACHGAIFALKAKMAQNRLMEVS